MKSTKLHPEIKEALYDPETVQKAKDVLKYAVDKLFDPGTLIIKGDRKKMTRLAKHLAKEHPSTKGKMTVFDIRKDLFEPTLTERMLGIESTLGQRMFWGFLSLDEHDLEKLPQQTYDEYEYLMQITPKSISNKWIEEFEDMVEKDKQRYRKEILERHPSTKGTWKETLEEKTKGKMKVLDPKIFDISPALRQSYEKLQAKETNPKVKARRAKDWAELEDAERRHAENMKEIQESLKLKKTWKETLEEKTKGKMKVLDQITIKQIDNYLQNEIPTIHLERLSENQKRDLYRSMTQKYHNIEINYIENETPETVRRILIGGQLDLMGHKIDINDNTTNSDLSKFLGVKVTSFKLYDPLTKRKSKPVKNYAVKFPCGKSCKIPSAWYDAMVIGIKKSSDVRNPYAIVKNIWAKLSPATRQDIVQRAAKGERFNYNLPLPDDRVTKGQGTLRMVRPFKLAEAQVNVSKKDMEAVKKSGIFRPMKREDGSICQVARCKGERPVNIFVDEV